MNSALPEQAILHPRHKARITAVLFGFVIWFLIIVVRLSQFMIFERDRYVQSLVRPTVFEGVIPAPRGRLLDRDGVPLAWSRRRFSLRWTVPATEPAARAEWQRLRANLPEALSTATLPGAPGATVVLCRSLTPAQAAKLAPLCAANRRLQLTGRFERQRYPDRDLARRLGRVVRRDGIEVGVSGLERANDAILRGRPGMFRVMVDREGRWLPETWEKVREMRPGYDVYLPVRLAALTGGGDA